MRRSVVALTLLLACAPVTRSPQLGPQPVSNGWQPQVALREKLVRGAPREVVLDDRDGLSADEAAILAIDQNPRLRVARAERGIDQVGAHRSGRAPESSSGSVARLSDLRPRREGAGLRRWHCVERVTAPFEERARLGSD